MEALMAYHMIATIASSVVIVSVGIIGSALWLLIVQTIFKI